MDVGATLVAYLEPPKAIEPREGALYHPAIPSESLARFDAAPCDAGDDAACAQCPSAPWIVVAFIGVQLRGALARSAAPPVGKA
jgi:hypothetical protein